MLIELVNKRRSARKRLGAPALVLVDRTLVPCSVRDISQTGAMLVFEEDVEIPDRLVMSFGIRPGTPRRCVVKWRNGRSVGVAFERT